MPRKWLLPKLNICLVLGGVKRIALSIRLRVPNWDGRAPGAGRLTYDPVTLVF